MITWIVASHDRTVLEANLLPCLTPLPPGDELVVLRSADSITRAYATGQAKATNPVRVYVHHDVRILDLPRMRAELIEATKHHGMVGVVGGCDLVMPWWDGEKLGSVVDARPGFGLLDFGEGGECAMLDGLLLATRQLVAWDTDAPGWHGYDHDACAQMLSRGLTNWCVTGAGDYIEHHSRSSSDLSTLDGWGVAVSRFRARWGS